MIVTREYGLSHDDVQRILPRVLCDAALSLAPLRIEARFPDGRALTVALAPEKERRLGRLRLVSTVLRFHFERFTDMATVDFLGRFDRATQKGGG